LIMRVFTHIGRFFFAALLFAGCGKPVVVDDDWNPLTGDYPVRIATRLDSPRTKVTSSSFDENDRIGVFGYYHNGSGSTDGSWAAETSAGTNIPDYMYNQLMTLTSGVWDYSPIKYWPNENRDGSTHRDKLSFWGYYPYGGSGITFRAHGTTTAYTNETSGLPDVYFTQSATPASQVDLLFSGLEQDLYKGDGEGHGNLTDGEVELSFRHSMADIDFEVKKEVAGEASLNDYIVTVTSITLTNLYESATYAEGSGWSGWTGSCPAVTLLGSPATIVVGGSAVAAGSLLAIPQALNVSSHEVTLNINYTLQNTADLGAGVVLAQEAHVPLKDAGVSAPVSWALGYHYTYTLTFRNQGLYIQVSVQPWDNAAEQNITTVIESNLLIEDETYLRYDEDGDFSTWTDSYGAVADGSSGGHLRSTLFRLITTSDAPGLKLITDNTTNFRFRKFNPGTGTYDAAVTELPIAAGTDVNTYYCVVPASASIPAEDADRKAQVYLVGASGLPYVPYNASVYPGNASNTSCQFYIVTPEVFDATYVEPYTHYKPQDK